MSVEAINNDLDSKCKRLVNWQMAQTAAKSFGSGQTNSTKVSMTTSIEIETASGMSNSDGDSYQPSEISLESVSVKVYGKNGKGVSSITFDESYTKTKFTSERPPDVTVDISSPAVYSLNENKDHLLETSEDSKDDIQTKNLPRKQEKEQESFGVIVGTIKV
jgi:hypothetical protein